MPDDRLFHKRLGHSEKVNRLSDFEYIVWQSYVLSADDFGVMRFSAAALCSDHDRIEARPAKAVQKALERVRDAGLIRTFSHQGRDYCYQDDWQDFQKIGYPRTTIHPAPPLATLSAKTRELFAKHPGGWGRKVSQTSDEPLPNVSETVTEPLAERLEEITPEPLAVSRQPLAISQKPLAVSHKPLAAVPPSADARSKRPIFRGQRLTVFEWMLDDIYRLLGKPAADALDVHAWFFELDARMAATSEAVPQRDGGRWLQQQALDEAERRGLISKPEHKSKLTKALEAASNGW